MASDLNEHQKGGTPSKTTGFGGVRCSERWRSSRLGPTLVLIDTDVNPCKYHNTPPPPTPYFFHAQVKGHGQNSLAAVHGRDIEPAKAGVGAGVQIHLVVVVVVVFILVSGREIIVEATEDSLVFSFFRETCSVWCGWLFTLGSFFFFFEKDDRAPTCSLLVCAFLVSVWCVVCVVIFKNVVETKEKWACLHVVVDIYPSSVVVKGRRETYSSCWSFPPKLM